MWSKVLTKIKVIVFSGRILNKVLSGHIFYFQEVLSGLLRHHSGADGHEGDQREDYDQLLQVRGRVSLIKT